MIRKTAEELRNMTSAEVLELWWSATAERADLVKRAGNGRASVEDLQAYMQLRKDMQPLHHTMIVRGLDIRYLNEGDTK